MPKFKMMCFSLVAVGMAGSMSLAQTLPSAEALELGKANYVDFCASCHAANGSGDVGPKISGSGKLADGAYVIKQITKGSGEMPGFGDVLSAEEIQGVANYIRTNLGNSFGYLTQEDIQKADP